MATFQWIAVLAVVYYKIYGVDCTTQQWVPNTNFGSDENWDSGHVPCGPVTVRIPEISPQIYVQLDTTIKELILPNSVELILGDGLNLVFSDDPKPSNCQDPSTGDVKFIATSSKSWFNPDNWCPVSSGGGKCTDLALLDTEMVPCSSDDVIFPLTSSYYVNLDSGFEINIGSLQLSGQSYSTSLFETFLTSDVGRRTFPPPAANLQSTLKVAGRDQCNDVTGCTCGNDDKKTMDKICGYRGPKCDTPFCHTTLKPTGSCCDLCGAILTITYGKGFRFNFLRDSVQSDFIQGKQANNGEIKYIVSKKSDKTIQMVLTDTAGNNSIPVAQAIQAALQKDISSGGTKYGITAVDLQISKGAFKPPAAHTAGKLDGGQIAGIIIGLIVIAAIVLVAAYFVYQRRTGSSVLQWKSFAPPSDWKSLPARGASAVRQKFRRSARSDNPYTASISFTDPTNINASLQGIDNPMYGTTGLQESTDRVVELPEIAPFQREEYNPPSTERGIDNPLYGQETGFYNNPAYTGLDDDNTI